MATEYEMVVAVTSLDGSKEKRKKFPLKNDTLAIRKAGGSDSSPQAKVIVLED